MENKIYSLIEKAKREQYPKKISRFKVSDVWAILNGFLQPEQYFEIEEIPNENLVKMQHGIMMHNYFEVLLKLDGWQTEVKLVYPYQGIEIVGVADALNENTILELKDTMQGDIVAKDWYTTQLKCYLTMFDKQEGFIAQPHFEHDDIFLRLVKGVRRDDQWFFDVCEKLLEYNEQLKSIKSVDI